MKTTQFYIVLNLKTTTGYECFGKFMIGNNRPFARSLFQQLNGSSDVDDEAMLTMELREIFNELPLNLQIISCTLEDVADNCRIITKETFKVMDLEEQKPD